MKKHIKQILCAFLVAILCVGVVVGIAACNDDNKGDAILLNVWLPQEDQAFGEEVAEAFKAAHPDKKYTIIFGTQSESDAGTKLLQDVTNAPDCFAFASDQILKLINGGALNRIGGERLDKIKKENTAAAVDAASVDVGGDIQTFAFPYTDNTFYLYYDKSKFTEDDIKTLDGILAKCSATEQFAYPLNDGWYSSAFYFGAGLGYSVKYDEAWGETVIDTDIDNSVGIEVAKVMLNLVNNPAFKPDSNDSKICAGFEDGSIIAGVSGVWNRNSIMESLGDNFGAAALPTYTLNNEQKQLVAFAGYKLMGVCNYSKVKSDALDFAEFFTSYEMQLKHFDARGFTPTNIEAAKEERIMKDPCALAMKAVLEHSKTQKNVPTTWWTPLQAFVNDMITNSSFDVKSQVADMVKNIRKGV